MELFFKALGDFMGDLGGKDLIKWIGETAVSGTQNIKRMQDMGFWGCRGLLVGRHHEQVPGAELRDPCHTPG